MRHVLLIAVVTVVALTACGGSSAGPTTTAGSVGPPVPTTLGTWIPATLGQAGATALLEVVRNDLANRGFDPSFDTQDGTVSLGDGRVLDLSTIASVVAGTDPTTWPGVVSRSLDTLLAP